MRTDETLQNNPHISRDALEELHEQLFGWAMSRCNFDRAAAEDLMQQAYIEVLNGQARFEQKSTLKTFMFGKVIMEHRQELNMTKKQFTTMRAIIVEVQIGVAEHEWDMQETYREVLARLDESPIDENLVLEKFRAVLKAENQVKLSQVTMLIKLRNLLTDEQVEYLKQNTGN